MIPLGIRLGSLGLHIRVMDIGNTESETLAITDETSTSAFLIWR